MGTAESEFDWQIVPSIKNLTEFSRTLSHGTFLPTLSLSLGRSRSARGISHQVNARDHLLQSFSKCSRSPTQSLTISFAPSFEPRARFLPSQLDCRMFFFFRWTVFVNSLQKDFHLLILKKG